MNCQNRKAMSAITALAVSSLCVGLAADVTDVTTPIHDEADLATGAELGPMKWRPGSARPSGIPQPIGSSNVIWDNGLANGAEPGSLGLITHPGAAPGGADASVIGAPATLFGGSFTRTAAGPNWARADDFTVGSGGWTVDSITVYGYVTGGDVGGNPFGAATFELNIWAGTPGFGNVIATTTTHNTPVFTNIYRQSTGNFPANTDRGIFAIEMVFPGGLELDPGTHWWDVQAVGPAATAWMPVVTLVNSQGDPITPEGNSLVLQADGTWLPGESVVVYDLPFLIKGTSHSCVGDLNGDSVVDVSDLLALLSAWGPNAGDPADFNGDGVVDVSDLLTLLGAWGACQGGGGPAPTGACCYADYTCATGISEEDCVNDGGTYGGDFNPCEICPDPDAGQSCEQALPVNIGETIASTTVGNTTPQLALCGGETPSGPTTWFTVTGDGTQVTAAACTNGGQSAMAVFCNSCDALSCIGGGSLNNEDPDCGNPFDAQVTWCALEGREYLVAVWRTDSPGDISVKVTSSGQTCVSTVDCGQLMDPVCTLPAANCQVRSGGTYITSDTNGGTDGFKSADDFQAAATGSITSVCWQGVELAPGFSVCANNLGQGLPFSVTYYADNGGIPGSVIGGPFVGNPTFARTAFIGFAFGDAGLIDYTMDHPPVNVTEGTCYWIEIVQQNGACLFLWAPSAGGNAVSYQSPGNVPYDSTHARTVDNTTNPDRTFCVSIDTGEPCDVVVLGACCEDGLCSITTADQCGGCFTIGGTCDGSPCIEEDYFYDCNLPIVGIGNDDPAVQWIWVQRYDVQPGMQTINEIVTGYAGDVQQGASVGWAIWDSATVPNSMAPTATGTVTADVGGVQTISIPATTITSGQFWIGVWTNGPYPMPGNALPPVAGDTWYMGTATIDPSALTLTDISTTTLAYRWVLRANAQ